MDTSGLEHRVGVTKSVLEVVRELLILLLLFALLFLPSQVRTFAKNLGITSFSTPFGEFELEALKDSTLEVATSVNRASDLVAEARVQLRALAPTTTQQTRPRVEAMLRGLDSSEARLRVAGSAVSRVLLRQQAALLQLRPGVLPAVGWLYVGRVDEQRRWVLGRPENIAPMPPQFRRGDIVVVQADSYLRGETSSAERSQAPVLRALQPNTRLEVQDVDSSRAPGGGWLVWLRVRVMP